MMGLKYFYLTPVLGRSTWGYGNSFRWLLVLLRSTYSSRGVVRERAITMLFYISRESFNCYYSGHGVSYGYLKVVSDHPHQSSII